MKEGSQFGKWKICWQKMKKCQNKQLMMRAKFDLKVTNFKA
jgi:hypothetical protein